jgi:hypothetical protein
MSFAGQALGDWDAGRQKEKRKYPALLSGTPAFRHSSGPTSAIILPSIMDAQSAKRFLRNTRSEFRLTPPFIPCHFHSFKFDYSPLQTAENNQIWIKIIFKAKTQYIRPLGMNKSEYDLADDIRILAAARIGGLGVLR